MIPFNIPPVTGKELVYLQEAIESHKICGDGVFTKKCTEWLERHMDGHKVLLTTSGTSALEMAALLCDIQAGDEVIMPSFTFCSTADAFVLRGAKIVFVDIRPDTLNIDETKIERAITEKTKAICVVHYAGVACEMDAIMDIARKHQLKVVEDAAQAICSTYKGRPLGTIGDFGCLSFHETKNFSMGEGGALIINGSNDIYERAEIIREKGTDRSKFVRGQIDKYTWRDCGSSYLPSDLNAAYLWAQFEVADEIQSARMRQWNRYAEAFRKINTPPPINSVANRSPALRTQRTPILPYHEIAFGAHRADFLPQGARHLCGIPLYSVALRPGRAEIRAVRRNGRNHDGIQRAYRPAAFVLRAFRKRATAGHRRSAFVLWRAVLT